MNIQQYETKDGNKRYILKGAYIGVDSLTGEQVRTTIRGKSEREVRRKYELKIREFEDNGCTKKKETSIKTFNDLIDIWLVHYADTVKASSYKETVYKIDGHVRPLIGNFKLEKLTPSLMQAKVDGFIKDVAGSLKNYKIVLATIKRIFKYAVALNLIEYNPMDRVLIRTVKREVDERKVKHYDKAEVKKLLEGLSNLDTDSWRDTLFSTFSKLLLYTGLRAGEALALEWSDIDFKDNMLSVSKTLYITGEISDTPKSLKSIRMIEIDDDTIEMLKEWKKFQLLKMLGGLTLTLNLK